MRLAARGSLEIRSVHRLGTTHPFLFFFPFAYTGFRYTKTKWRRYLEAKPRDDQVRTVAAPAKKKWVFSFLFGANFCFYACYPPGILNQHETEHGVSWGMCSFTHVNERERANEKWTPTTLTRTDFAKHLAVTIADWFVTKPWSRSIQLTWAD